MLDKPKLSRHVMIEPKEEIITNDKIVEVEKGKRGFFEIVIEIEGSQPESVWGRFIVGKIA